MTRTRACLTAFAAMLMTSAIAHAAELADPDGLRDHLESQIQARGIPGAVALIVDADGIVYESAHGRRDVGSDVPMTPDTIFRLASMYRCSTTLVPVGPMHTESRLLVRCSRESRVLPSTSF